MLRQLHRRGRGKQASTPCATGRPTEACWLLATLVASTAPYIVDAQSSTSEAFVMPKDSQHAARRLSGRLVGWLAGWRAACSRLHALAAVGRRHSPGQAETLSDSPLKASWDSFQRRANAFKQARKQRGTSWDGIHCGLIGIWRPCMYSEFCSELFVLPLRLPGRQGLEC